MTRYTQAGQKIGTTEYYAIVRWMVPDPEGDIERAGENYRDDTASETFPTLPQAAAWAKRNVKGKDGVEAFIEVVEYERDEFTDPKYGHIVDGERRVARTLYARWDDGKIVGWDEE